jgi:hypothetical protein
MKDTIFWNILLFWSYLAKWSDELFSLVFDFGENCC